MSTEPRNQDEPRDASLSQLYRESGAPEPPAAIDQALLALARREARAGPRRVGSWPREWRVPLSIAATIVVSASLVMLMVEEGGNRIEETPPVASVPMRKESPAPDAASTDDLTLRNPAAAAPDSAERVRDERSQIAREPAESESLAERDALKSAAKREPVPEARLRAETPRAQPVPPPPARPFPSDSPASSVAPRGELEQRAVPPPAASTPRAAEVPAGAELSARQPARRERTEDAGAAPGASRPGLGVRDFVDDQTTDQPGALPKSTARGARGLAAPQQGEGVDRQLSRASPSQDAIGRAAPADPPKDGAPAVHAQERRDAASGTTVSPPAAKRLPSPLQAAPKPKPKPESRGVTLARDLLDQPPEKWLERVEQLRREERYGDADELLDEFRRRFPAHPAAQQAPER